MKYCKVCGAKLNDNAVICIRCGSKAEKAYTVNKEDKRDFGWAILGFILPPIIGFILYLVWKDKLPLRAASIGIGTLVGIVVPIVLSIISFMFGLGSIALIIGIPLLLL